MTQTTEQEERQARTKAGSPQRGLESTTSEPLMDALLPDEDPAEFVQLCERYRRCFRSGLARQLAARLAFHDLQLQRVARAEAGLIKREQVLVARRHDERSLAQFHLNPWLGAVRDALASGPEAISADREPAPTRASHREREQAPEHSLLGAVLNAYTSESAGMHWRGAVRELQTLANKIRCNGPDPDLDLRVVRHIVGKSDDPLLRLLISRYFEWVIARTCPDDDRKEVAAHGPEEWAELIAAQIELQLPFFVIRKKWEEWIDEDIRRWEQEGLALPPARELERVSKCRASAQQGFASTLELAMRAERTFGSQVGGEHSDHLPFPGNVVLTTLFSVIHLSPDATSLLVGDFTNMVNRALRGDGEGVHLDCREVGSILTSFGLESRKRTSKGYKLWLDRASRQKIHELAKRHGLANPTDSPVRSRMRDCTMCQGKGKGTKAQGKRVSPAKKGRRKSKAKR